MAIDSCSASSHNLATQYAEQLTSQTQDRLKHPAQADQPQTQTAVPNGPTTNTLGETIGTQLSTTA